MKRRVTLLFNSVDQFADHWNHNGTHLVVDAVETGSFVVQNRYQWDNLLHMPLQENELTSKTDHGNFTVRVTWNPSGSILNQTILDSWKQFGFNFYTDNLTIDRVNGLPLINSNKYRFLHLNEFAEQQTIDDFIKLPLGAKTMLKWDLERCSYDILATANSLKIDESCQVNTMHNFTITQIMDEVLEVGLFYVDSIDMQDINLSGLRCKWSENEKIWETCLKTSLFYKSGVNWTYNSQAAVEFVKPTGLHPKISINLSSEKINNNANCDYYLHALLPPELFVDKFQQSSIFAFGEHDLELPEYKLTKKSWGSEALFLLHPGEIDDVVLHSRYIEPLFESSNYNTKFVTTVFKGCDGNPLTIERNPFYTKSLGLESFFTDDTKFYILSQNELNVTIPRPGIKYFDIVQQISGIIIALGILYLFQGVISISFEEQKVSTFMKKTKEQKRSKGT